MVGNLKPFLYALQLLIYCGPSFAVSDKSSSFGYDLLFTKFKHLENQLREQQNRIDRIVENQHHLESSIDEKFASSVWKLLEQHVDVRKQIDDIVQNQNIWKKNQEEKFFAQDEKFLRQQEDVRSRIDRIVESQDHLKTSVDQKIMAQEATFSAHRTDITRNFDAVQIVTKAVNIICSGSFGAKCIVGGP